jgi:hypothetical protein
VQHHEGRIELDSEIGVGTTVRFWLPGEEMDIELVDGELEPQSADEISQGSDYVATLD